MIVLIEFEVGPPPVRSNPGTRLHGVLDVSVQGVPVPHVDPVQPNPAQMILALLDEPDHVLLVVRLPVSAVILPADAGLVDLHGAEQGFGLGMPEHGGEGVVDNQPVFSLTSILRASSSVLRPYLLVTTRKAARNQVCRSSLVSSSTVPAVRLVCLSHS